MNLKLREGQEFPKQYILSKKVTSGQNTDSFAESWIATQTQTGDRVLVKFFKNTYLDDDAWSSVEQSAITQRGLVHQNISLIIEAGIENGIQYVIEPNLTDCKVLDLDDPKIWPTIQQIIGALVFAHDLGIVHGTLCPEDISIDASGIVHLSSFALPQDVYSDNQRAFLSPQVLAGREPCSDDDIYSLGCILYRAITGKRWRKGVEIDSPIDERLELELRAMVSESPFERSTNLLGLLESLENHFENNSTAIEESMAFSRHSSLAKQTNITEIKNLTTNPRDQGLPMQWVLAAGFFLLVFTSLIFTFLPLKKSTGAAALQPPPSLVTPRKTITTSEAQVDVTPLEASRIKVFQEQSEELTRDIIRQQLALEDIGVIIWAPIKYDQIVADLDTAENLYRQKQFQAASNQYRTVSAGLKQLQSDAISELKKQTAQGEKALEVGDSKTAIKSFTIATSIDSKSEHLQGKLARAERLEQVKRLVFEGEVQERNGELDRAIESFISAKNLDSEWSPATQGISRIQRVVAQRDFKVAMSNGYLEISNKNYETARDEFSRAKNISPNSREPDEGLMQIEQLESNNIILKHQQNAKVQIASENWQGAIEEYEAALAIANSLEFAKEGLAQAKSRLALQERLKEFLSDPTLLQSEAGLADARLTLRLAHLAAPKTETLLNHTDILARLISTARKKIPVTIISNGKTEVTVRRHAALGKLTNKVVNLIPGRYIVVGQRLGYRDVRQELVLLAGQTSPTLEIASTARVK